MNKRFFIHRLALAALCASGLSSLQAAAAEDSYPSRPVKIIVGFQAGGPTDVTARLVARALQDIFYDPQTSGGLLCAVPAAEAEACLAELRAVAPSTRIIGYVTEKLDSAIYLEA